MEITVRVSDSINFALSSHILYVEILRLFHFISSFHLHSYSDHLSSYLMFNSFVVESVSCALVISQCMHISFADCFFFSFCVIFFTFFIFCRQQQQSANTMQCRVQFPVSDKIKFRRMQSFCMLLVFKFFNVLSFLSHSIHVVAAKVH
jgi:hypothetical protein